jgi:hypothetical protein
MDQETDNGNQKLRKSKPMAGKQSRPAVGSVAGNPNEPERRGIPGGIGEPSTTLDAAARAGKVK